MQKTGLTKYSLFLFWPGLGKGMTYIVVINMGQPITIFLCIGPFSAW